MEALRRSAESEGKEPSASVVEDTLNRSLRQQGLPVRAFQNASVLDIETVHVVTDCAPARWQLQKAMSWVGDDSLTGKLDEQRSVCSLVQFRQHYFKPLIPLGLVFAFWHSGLSDLILQGRETLSRRDPGASFLVS